jgi:hypothetical protein
VKGKYEVFIEQKRLPLGLKTLKGWHRDSIDSMMRAMKVDQVFVIEVPDEDMHKVLEHLRNISPKKDAAEGYDKATWQITTKNGGEIRIKRKT